MELRDILNRQGFHVVGKQVWLIEDFLDLKTPLMEERRSYVKGLKSASILLNSKEDYLLWIWNNATTIPSVHQIYNALVFEQSWNIRKWWN